MPQKKQNKNAREIRRDTTATVPLKVPRPRFEGSAPMWPRVPWPRFASPCHCDQWAFGWWMWMCLLFFWGMGTLWHWPSRLSQHKQQLMDYQWPTACLFKMVFQLGRVEHWQFEALVLSILLRWLGAESSHHGRHTLTTSFTSGTHVTHIPSGHPDEYASQRQLVFFGSEHLLLENPKQYRNVACYDSSRKANDSCSRAGCGWEVACTGGLSDFGNICTAKWHFLLVFGGMVGPKYSIQPGRSNLKRVCAMLLICTREHLKVWNLASVESLRCLCQENFKPTRVVKNDACGHAAAE